MFIDEDEYYFQKNNKKRKLDIKTHNLLPKDFANELNIEQSDFESINKEKKSNIIVVYKKIGSKMSRIENDNKNDALNNSIPKNQIKYYKVKVWNEIIIASSLLDVDFKEGDLVIMEYENYMFMGMIKERISYTKSLKTCYRITTFRRDSSLYDSLKENETKALEYAKHLVKCYNINTEVYSCHFLGYLNRNLLRVNVSNKDAENIHLLVGPLMRLFLTSVQLTDGQAGAPGSNQEMNAQKR